MKGRSLPSKVVRTHLPNQLYTGERMLMIIMVITMTITMMTNMTIMMMPIVIIDSGGVRSFPKGRMEREQWWLWGWPILRPLRPKLYYCGCMSRGIHMSGPRSKGNPYDLSGVLYFWGNPCVLSGVLYCWGNPYDGHLLFAKHTSQGGERDCLWW